jgi:hypothetical protein
LASTLTVTAALPAHAAQSAPGQDPATYDLTLLEPSAGEARSAALGISANGLISGVSAPTRSPQPQHGALWDSTTHRPIDLPQLDGSKFARAFAVNDAGSAVGEAFTATGTSVPITWKDSQATHLLSLNAEGTGILNDINTSGAMVGTAFDGTALRALVVQPNGAVTPLPLATGEGYFATGARGNAIADSGSVAGSSTVTETHGDHGHSSTVATLWKQTGLVLLPSIDDDVYASAADVNNSDIAVGEYQRGGVSTAVKWVDDQLHILATPNTPDFPHSTARAINTNGDIVGYSSKYLSNSSFGGAAVLWHGDTALDLNEAADLPDGVRLVSASDVNDAGQIVGSATTPDGDRGFLLTPSQNPEPVVPTVSITGVSAHYHAGAVATASAVQAPANVSAKHRWFTRATAADAWTEVAGATTSNYGFVVATEHQIKVALYDSADSLIAESDPVEILIDDHGAALTVGPELEVSLRDNEGALVVSVDPGCEKVEFSDLALNPAADRYVSSGILAGITVSDTRSDRLGWSVSGRVRGLVTVDGDHIDGKYLGWKPSVTAASEGLTVAAGAPQATGFLSGTGISNWSVLGTAPAQTAPGLATLRAELSLEAPLTTPAGTYTGVILLTVI